MMAAYLVVSLITGFACAAISFLWFGVPLWAMGLFYIAGCWSGFLAALTIFMVIGPRDKSKNSDWSKRPATR